MPLPILLVNPNTSTATTAMMVAIARATATPGWTITGATAQQGVGMVTNEAEMQMAAHEVPHTWQRAGPGWAGTIVSAFGDPGMAQLRRQSAAPVVGICEASILEAAQGGRRFGIATVTPALQNLIQSQVEALGLGHAYSGIRLTRGDPRVLASDPAALADALAQAVQQCVTLDGAEVVIIGGGPLAQVAQQLQAQLGVQLVAPIPAAVRQLQALLA